MHQAIIHDGSRRCNSIVSRRVVVDAAVADMLQHKRWSVELRRFTINSILIGCDCGHESKTLIHSQDAETHQEGNDPFLGGDNHCNECECIRFFSYWRVSPLLVAAHGNIYLAILNLLTSSSWSLMGFGKRSSIVTEPCSDSLPRSLPRFDSSD